MPDSTAPRWVSGSVAAIGILMAALNLRTAVAALSPVLDRIGAEIPLSALLIAVLGSVPPLSFALSGLLAPRLARRLGLEVTLVTALVVMALGHVLRAASGHGAVLVAASILTLVGVGTATVLMPPLVKRYFAERVGPVTAGYSTAMAVGASVPPAIAVPLAELAGWRISLGVWAVLALLAVPPWLLIIRGHRRDLAGRLDEAATDSIAVVPAEASVRVHRSPTAWAILSIFAISGITAYASFGWLPRILVETAGVTTAEAGALLALFAAMGLPASILAPLLAARMRSVAPMVIASALFATAGSLGLLLAPAAAPWLWSALLGLGPLLFPLSMYLMGSRSRTPATAIAVSGFVTAVGYVVAATGPLLVGVLHDATGGWTVPLMFLLLVGVAALPAALVLRRDRMIDDEAGLDPIR